MLASVDLRKARLFGKGYIIDSVKWGYRERVREDLKWTYLTTAITTGAQGKYLTIGLGEKLEEFDNPKELPKETAEEAVDNFLERAGITYGDKSL